MRAASELARTYATLQVLKRLSRRRLLGQAVTALNVAQGMVAIMTGQPANEAAARLERALAAMGTQIENWDMPAALWWPADSGAFRRCGGHARVIAWASRPFRQLPRPRSGL
jgi:hypothetical protein